MTKLFDDTDDATDDLETVVIPEDEPLKPFLEKYKDPKGVAKALVEKDSFIKRLQKENAEARAELVTRTKVEEVVDRLLLQKNDVTRGTVDTNAADQQNSNNEPAQRGLSLEDVESLLQKKEQEIQAKQNLAYSKRELEKAYGKDWVKVVSQKAKEIGESVEFFDTLAQTKPNVLLSLLAKNEPARPQAPSLFTPSASVNTTSDTLNLSGNQQRTMAFYNKLKAADPVKYRSPAIQNQMHKDALQLREAFFDV